MGLYLLNISVDSSDQNLNSIPEDLSINDQESIIEIIIEKVLGFENAIEEYDDHDSENQIKKAKAQIDLIYQYFGQSAESELIVKGNGQSFSYLNSYPGEGFLYLLSPPPKI